MKKAIRVFAVVALLIVGGTVVSGSVTTAAHDPGGGTRP